MKAEGFAFLIVSVRQAGYRRPGFVNAESDQYDNRKLNAVCILHFIIALYDHL